MRTRWVVGTYLAVGVSWILVSSGLAALAPDAAWIEAGKGIGFVLVTAAVLAVVLDRWAERLHDTDQRFRSLIESSGEVVYRLRTQPEPRLEYVSPTANALLGLSPDHVFTHDALLLAVHPEDRATVAALPTPDVASHAVRVQAFDGRIVHLDHCSLPVLDRRRHVEAVDVRLRDVTEATRDRAELALRSDLTGWLDDGLPVSEVLHRACLGIVDALDVHLAWIAWRRPDGRVEVMASAGPSSYLDGLDLRWDRGPLAEGPPGTSMREGRAVLFRPRDTAYAPWRPRALQIGFNTSLAVPVRVHGEVVGSLSVHARYGCPFEPSAVARFERLARFLGFVLEPVENLGLLVRRHQLTDAVARLGRRSQPYVMAVVVSSRLAALRRSAGFAAGEAALAVLADRLRAGLPAGTDLARTGDDELTVLLPDDGTVPARLADLLAALREPVDLPAGPVALRVTVGAVRLGVDDDAEARFRAAVSAAVAADQRPRHAVVWVDEEQTVGSAAARTGDLRSALDRGEIEVWFQPIVASRTGQVVAAEALARWRHDGEVLTPGDFLVPAEECGLLVPIGRHVLATAVARASEWCRHGLQRVCVNATADELLEDGYLALVDSLLRHHDLPASALEIEVVETVALDAAAVAVLRALQARGVRVAVDDYGTGWSSMAYLVQFRFDTLKIDRMFVADLPVDPRLRSLVDATVAMGRALGIEVVAEGVEDAEQAELLRRAGCDLLQGYGIARPAPAADLGVLLAGAPVGVG